jgi:ABC-type multidrug transport system fused ATPase/permease subunit
MFGISGENLTKRIRSKAFKSILSQEVAWFDQVENSVGVLSTRLSTEAAAVQGASGVTIGFLLLNIGNLGIGLALSFAYSWTITLLVLGFMPFIIISGILQTKVLTGFSGSDKEVLEEAGKIANESLSNIRTVAAFNLQKYYYNLYTKNIEIPYK